MDPTSPIGRAVLPLAVGDVVRLRRRHPCGGTDWRVTRTGADIGIACVTCGRRVLLDRRDLERRIVHVEPSATAGAREPGA